MQSTRGSTYCLSKWQSIKAIPLPLPPLLPSLHFQWSTTLRSLITDCIWSNNMLYSIAFQESIMSHLNVRCVVLQRTRMPNNVCETLFQCLPFIFHRLFPPIEYSDNYSILSVREEHSFLSFFLPMPLWIMGSGR